ncbi:MAG: serine/threonine protein kinase [Elusimicrobia bacterium]|nr:MAG: serine/threonine protein kinase [Elusimicrobiota bacterium]KAF0153720.1 MAG: serine/threonine protein kinase [Elusimicrobiota bacterium]
MNTEDELKEGTVFAGCRIAGKIGQGGMGTVYKAYYEALGKDICIKFLSPALARDARNIEFFMREARSAARLDHPNIVHIYNFGQENEVYFIIMSYVEGQSLSDLILEKGPLPVDKASEIIIEVLEGLGHAHSKTIIHRDIKPSNILITSDGRPRIVDFGLARSISEEKQLTMAGEMVGTAYFMSPEQGLAGTVDHRADLYAAGATLFYILTGRHPFEGKSSIEVIHKHIGDPPPNIVLIKPDVPLWVSAVIDRSMRKKPADRYQTAEEMAGVIRKYLKEGMSSSNEMSLDIPELTQRIKDTAARQEPSRDGQAAQAKPDRSATAPPPPPPPPAGPQPRPARTGPAVQHAGLHRSARFLLHLALSLAAPALALLAGSAGAGYSGQAHPLLAPLVYKPFVSLFCLAAAGGLFAWAQFTRHHRFAFWHTAISLAALLAAYSAGAFIHGSAGFDTVSRAFLAASMSAMGATMIGSLPVYTLFLVIAGSFLMSSSRLAAKAAGALLYLLAYGALYMYLRPGPSAAMDPIYFYVSFILVLSAIAAGAAQKSFNLLLNPPVLMAAALAVLFVGLMKPALEAEVAAAAARDDERVKVLRRQEIGRRQLLAAEEITEFDLDGRPLQRPALPDIDQVVPYKEPAELRAMAKLNFVRAMKERMGADTASSGALLLLAALLTLLANGLYLSEAARYYRQEEP